MDPNSSLGKICLGENIVEIFSDRVEGSGDWNSLEFQDTANSGQMKNELWFFTRWIPKKLAIDSWLLVLLMGWKLMMGRLILEGDYLFFLNFIINPEEDDVEPGVILERSFLRMTKAITDFGVGTVTIYLKIDPFLKDIEEEEKKEEMPIIETMAYHDKYKKILDEIWKDKVELDGKIVKKEEEAVKRIKGKALKEKDDPGAFIFPIRLEGQEKRIEKVVRGINNVNHTQAEDMGILTNVLCQVGVSTLIANFLILDIMIDHDSPIVFGRGFLRTIGGIVNTPERLFSTFDEFCHQTFRDARSDVMRNAESDSDDEEDYQIKRNKFRAPIYGPKPASYINCNDPDERSLAIQTVTNPFRKISVWKKAVSFLGSLPVPLKQVNWKPNYKGSYTKEKEATGQLWENTMMRPDHHDPNALDNMKPWKKIDCDGEIDDMLRIRLREARSDEEIFTLVAWIRAFNINEPIYAELCYEFYSTYELDEVYADDELQTKKIIKFRLGGRAQSLTLLEFARRLGLYQAVQLEEEGFIVYFKEGLRSDEHFNAQDYWLSISREENLGLSRSRTSTIMKLILRVIHKMITYGLCQRTTSLGDCKMDEEERSWHQKESSNFVLEQFISKIARKCRVLTEDVVRSLKICLIRMGRMEIRQEAIERMEYRQSYHWDRELQSHPGYC
ncbi:hypothetical protein Tco_0489846 [Tanacetum coccineum]